MENNLELLQNISPCSIHTFNLANNSAIGYSRTGTGDTEVHLSQQLLDDDFSFEPEEDMVPLRNAITKSLMVSKGATTAD